MGRQHPFEYAKSFLDDVYEDMFNRDLLPPRRLRPYEPLMSALSFHPKSLSELKKEKDKFKVLLNVSQFKPEEIEVKLVDNHVVIHGKHEEKLDEHGSIQREFTRRYLLPEGTDSEALTSTWNYRGILIIEAPKKATEPSDKRVIPIKVVTEKSEVEGITNNGTA